MNRIAIGLYLASIFASWYITATYKDAIWQGRISVEHEQAAKLAAEQGKIALSYQNWINELNDQVEIEHAKAQKSIANLRAGNTVLAGGVRTTTTQVSSCPMPGDTGTAPNDNTGRTPSAELFPIGTAKALVGFAARADEVTNTARACQKWVGNIRKD